MALTHSQPPGRTARARIGRGSVTRFGLVVLLATIAAGGAFALRGRFFGASNACCAQWQRSTLTGETDALLADPNAPARLFAGTTDGLWISGDAGVTWSQARQWNRGIAIQSLAAGGSHMIYVGADDGAVYAGSGADIDGAWPRISPALGSSPVFSLAYNAHLRVLMAGTAGGLYRGQQRGTRWQWRKVAATGDSAVTAIAWTPWDPPRGYASVFGTQPPLLSTTDGGRTWQADARGLPSTLPTEALLTGTAQGRRVWLSTMGGGVWLRSRNGTWRDVSTGLPARHAMPLVAGPGGTLYAGTMGYGVYATQGLHAWRRVGQGLIGGQYIVLSLALADPKHPILLAGTSRGVYRYGLPS